MKHLKLVSEHQMNLNFNEVNKEQLADMIEAIMDECLEIYVTSYEEGIQSISGTDDAAKKIVEMMVREKIIQ